VSTGKKLQASREVRFFATSLLTLKLSSLIAAQVSNLMVGSSQPRKCWRAIRLLQSLVQFEIEDLETQALRCANWADAAPAVIKEMAN
jgi:hypothetical protein